MTPLLLAKAQALLWREIEDMTGNLRIAMPRSVYPNWLNHIPSCTPRKKRISCTLLKTVLLDKSLLMAAYESFPSFGAKTIYHAHWHEAGTTLPKVA